MTTDKTMYGVVDDPARLRQVVEIAAAEAAVLRGVIERLDAAGLLGPTNAGPKLRTRLELAAKRLDEIGQYVRRRLAKLEPAADTRSNP